jgi:hypothetical protein
MDAQMGGLDAAHRTKNTRLPVETTCNKAGGEYATLQAAVMS